MHNASCNRVYTIINSLLIIIVIELRMFISFDYFLKKNLGYLIDYKKYYYYYPIYFLSHSFK